MLEPILGIQTVKNIIPRYSRVQTNASQPCGLYASDTVRVVIFAGTNFRQNSGLEIFADLIFALSEFIPTR